MISTAKELQNLIVKANGLIREQDQPDGSMTKVQFDELREDASTARRALKSENVSKMESSISILKDYNYFRG